MSVSLSIFATVGLGVIKVLRVGATLFDPLGFISPITKRVKSIFQLLCKDKSDWDDNISGKVLRVWEKFLVDLENFTDWRVKRFVFVEITDHSKHLLRSICMEFMIALCRVIVELFIYKFLLLLV